MKLKNWFIICTAIGCALLLMDCKSKPIVENPSATGYNFFVLSDMGSTGIYREDSVAHTINRLAKKYHPRYVINQGDFFHDQGVRDAKDSLWNAQFENMFNVPELNVKWYSILGNHEYIGNPQALIDYGKVSTRWTLPARNYTFVQAVDSNISIRFVMIDTSPFLFFYHKDPKYYKVNTQNENRTVEFVDSVLAQSHEKWKVVIGHHPVYTSDFNQGNTYGLIEKIAPLLEKYHVDFYLNGHVHKFEHVQRDGVDYMITTSGVKARWTNPWFYTRFVNKALGFTICKVDERSFSFFFLNEKGETLYCYKKQK